MSRSLHLIDGSSIVDHRDWVQAMREGDFAKAWTISETFNAHREPATRDDPSRPYHCRWVWDGSDLAGRDVVVRCYHGLGDTIQFLRYLRPLRAVAASVVLELPRRLAPLIENPSAGATVVPFDMAAPLARRDADIEIMELALALKLPPFAVPPPYVSATPAELPRCTIGLCSRAGDWDGDRSLPADLLAPLCSGRSCISLDPEPCQLPVLNPEGCPYDMTATAALVAGCSLVITVDTMIAHLAGAMNKPTWVLLKHEPDWRWSPQTGRSVWYPSMRLFSQPSAGNWHCVATEVAGALNACFPAMTSRP